MDLLDQIERTEFLGAEFLMWLWYVADEGEGTITLPDGPAEIHFDDQLVLATWMAAPGNSSFRSRHRFTRNGELMAEGDMVHVCVERETRATVPVPNWLRDLCADDEWRPD